MTIEPTATARRHAAVQVHRFGPACAARVARATRLAFSACVACAVPAAVGWVPSAAAAPRAAADVEQTRTQFDTVTLAYRKAVLNVLDATQAPARDVLSDVRFFFDRSSIPRLTHVRRLGETMLGVSDGWLTVVADLARAACASGAVNAAPSSASAEAQKPPACAVGVAASPTVFDCHGGYAAHVVRTLKHNDDVVALRRGVLHAVARFAEFEGWDGDGAKPSCNAAERRAASSRAADEAVETATDAALAWVVGRGFASMLRGVATGAFAVEPGEGHPDCREDDADRWTVERMFALRIDPLPAQSALLLHALQSRQAPTEAGCNDGRARLAAFFKTVGDKQGAWRAKFGHSQSERMQHQLSDARLRAVRAWVVATGPATADAKPTAKAAPPKP